MTDLIRVTAEQLDERIEAIEADHPQFVALWNEPSCSCCKTDWDWSMEKIDAWDNYRTYRWLRGDVEPGEADDDD